MVLYSPERYGWKKYTVEKKPAHKILVTKPQGKRTLGGIL